MCCDGPCEPITVNACRGKGVIHHYTRTPIELPYGPGSEDLDRFQTQHEAIHQLRPYLPLLSRGRGCREYFKPLACAAYLPACEDGSDGAVPPCRDLCEMARAKCWRSVRHVGLGWPRQLDCSRFPRPTENSACISALNLGQVEVTGSSTGDVEVVEVRVTCSYDLSPHLQPQWLAPDGHMISDDERDRIFAQRTDKHTTTLVVLRYMDSFDSGNYSCVVGNRDFVHSVTLANIYEPAADPTTCEPIQGSWWCQSSINYAEIQLPNAYGMATQEEIRHKLERYGEVARSGCSRYLSVALCSTYLSPCNTSREAKPALCRDLCEQVGAECADIIRDAGIAPLPCEELVYQADGDCYNGIKIGPATVLDTATGKRVEVICHHASKFWSAWITPNSTKLYAGVTPESARVTVESEGSNVLRLIINDFVDSQDAGIYTCSDGESYSRSITLDSIHQPNPSSNEVVIGDVHAMDMNGVPFIVVACAYNSRPAFQPIWLDLYGSEVPPGSFPLDQTPDFSTNIKAVNTTDSITTLVITDFQDAIHAGVYTCQGQGPDSAKTVSIGDISRGPLATNQMPPSGVNEILISDVVSTSVGGSTFVAVACIYIAYPVFQPVWLDLYGSVVPQHSFSSDKGPDLSIRIQAVNSSESVTTLLITDFKDATDAGVYTCQGQGPDSAKTVVIGDISRGPLATSQMPPSGVNEVLISDVISSSVGGSTVITVPCVYVARPTFQPVWLDLYGSVVPLRNISVDQESDLTIRIQAVSSVEGVSVLLITDFQDATDAGVYTCQGQGPDSAKTVVIGDISQGPLADGRPEKPLNEVSISDVISSSVGGSTVITVPCVYVARPTFQPVWLDLYGSVVPLRNFSLDQVSDLSIRIQAVSSVEGVSVLLITDFQNATDAGVYTCRGEGPDSAKTVVIGDISQGPLTTSQMPPSGVKEVRISEIVRTNVAGLDMTAVQCTYILQPAFQPVWLDLYGSVVSKTQDPLAHIQVVHSSDSITALLIMDFQDATDAGVYTCLGQEPDSAETVIIGDISLGPLANRSQEPSDKQPSCEEIQIPACSVGISYSSTYVPNLVGLSQDELGPIFSRIEPALAGSCGSYLRAFMCALYLPPCRELAVLPCQELCLANVDKCTEELEPSFSPDDLAQMREQCTQMPSESDPTIPCHNGKEVRIGSVEGSGTDVIQVECTYNLLPTFQPRWFSPTGHEILTDSEARIQVVHSRDSVTTLVIKDFQDATDAGVYTCLGQGPDFGDTVAIGNISLGPQANRSQEPSVAVPAEQPTCEEIRIPACSAGIGYSSTFVPNLVGLSQDELGPIFSRIEPALAGSCGSYLRAFTCALYLPPCREQAVLPCQELCLTNVDKCAEALGPAFSRDDLADMREKCANMPSESDPTIPCHNVEEVKIGSVKGSGTDVVQVECTYNLLPPFQPRWFSPTGREILTGSYRRVRVIETSNSVTMLEINNYDPRQDQGTYTCAGQNQQVTVDL
ncbi:uncharacterized protein LOC110989943 isoform X2 [Acanthaster planci]|uniref:Uncharacterized protein LOC110989943 isoform X2 n=1 Tax=Acanthaster planci TaxID=133434 RepID=A0A8B8A394_ACAPL|nr:uncharacterized protein LOC110989943 isoform X2 [Acanthaster planci]